GAAARRHPGDRSAAVAGRAVSGRPPDVHLFLRGRCGGRGVPPEAYAGRRPPDQRPTLSPRRAGTAPRRFLQAPTEHPMNRFARVVQILDTAIGGPQVNIGVHGAFWRNVSRDQFVAKKVQGLDLLVVGNGAASNLVKALKGEAPFGADLDNPP